MPGKRKGDQLTGGTGDVNGQYMVIPFTTPSPLANASAVAVPVSTVLPIPRYPEKGGKSIVMELLNVEFVYTGTPSAVNNNPGGSGENNYIVALTTNPNVPANAAALITDPRTLQYDVWTQTWYFSTAVGFQVEAGSLIREYDMTDNAGHGVLVATDNVFIQQTASNGVNANTTGVPAACVLFYRFKEVGLAEYVGIVQSQQ
jgi:hypothetical protein